MAKTLFYAEEATAILWDAKVFPLVGLPKAYNGFISLDENKEIFRKPQQVFDDERFSFLSKFLVFPFFKKGNTRT